MEVQCPRCESTFAVEPLSLRQHQGLLQCSVCGEVFRVPIAAPAVAKSLEAESARRGGIGRWFLLAIIVFLFLVLVVQILWWTRSYAYLASSPVIRNVIVQAANGLGVEAPWPGPNREIQIVQSTVTPLPNHLALIRGQLENGSRMVQAYPQIQVVLSNAYGSTIRTLTFAPDKYLPGNVLPRDGFAPGHKVSFALQGPQLEAAPGYQVTILSLP
ncbi:zinc-ribbon and DUF3426 domain-containing protein [Acidithiobacillus sp. AMEEHan]|uniref:zinc-ribbon and DUF3426 domain-containing protein n=1 Tax=Acidithiobacillus sp. AMEEHan TaxID=2994951 RepID=UPI0027E433A6|nr:zinc-ribbon and DUF3426 domain-containing protein [Acidithiobacillus sp. AMEEHan]